MKLTGGLMSSDNYLIPLVACLRVLAPQFLLLPFVVLRGIRGFQRLELREFVPATACVSLFSCFSPSDPMYFALSY